MGAQNFPYDTVAMFMMYMNDMSLNGRELVVTAAELGSISQSSIGKGGWATESRGSSGGKPRSMEVMVSIKPIQNQRRRQTSISWALQPMMSLIGRPRIVASLTAVGRSEHAVASCAL